MNANDLNWRMIMGIVLWTVVCSIIFYGCLERKNSTDNQIDIWESTEPLDLNPLTASDAISFNIIRIIFQPLLSYDFSSYELIPVLANDLPIIHEKNDSIVSIKFEINPLAQWNKNISITAKDILFTFKAILCPNINSALSAYVVNIEEIIIKDENPLEITFLVKNFNFQTLNNLGAEIYILPEYKYDPTGILRNVHFTELKQIKLGQHPELDSLGSRLTSAHYIRDHENIIGSGAYYISDWKTDQFLNLKRKRHWWYEDIAQSQNPYYLANPKQINFKFITDPVSAVTAVKAGDLDIAHTVNVSLFSEMRINSMYKSSHNFFSPNSSGFSYLGLNNNDMFFNNKSVRFAIAHLVNYNRIINDVYNGMAVRTIGSVSPNLSGLYNSKLDPVQYDRNTARKLLHKAGWSDTNGDGVLDKNINGRKIDFRITLLYNSGNHEREKIALILKNDFNAVGIDLILSKLEVGVFMSKIINKEFDLFLGSWTSTTPIIGDQSQLWHSRNIPRGSNFISYQNLSVDALLDSIYESANTAVPQKLVYKFQEIIFNDQPYVFLVVPQNRIIANKRLTNLNLSSIYPGYWIPGVAIE